MAATGAAGGLRPVPQEHEFMDCVSRRQVPRAPAAVPVPASADGPVVRTAEGAIVLPLALLERLRGLEQAYQQTLDTIALGYGFAGGCRVELGRGLLWPPGVRPPAGGDT